MQEQIVLSAYCPHLYAQFLNTVSFKTENTRPTLLYGFHSTFNPKVPVILYPVSSIHPTQWSPTTD